MIKAYAEKARDQEDFSEVRVVGMDEIAARRGHDYVTLFVDLEEKRTIFVTDGKDQRVLDAFATDLAEHSGNPDQMTQLSCDMSPAFIKGVENTLPNAAIVIDRFHVTKVINEAVDKLRKDDYTIQRHWAGIVNWIDYKISNGILEGFNSIFQAAKNKARGY